MKSSSLFETFADIVKSHNRVMSLAAIWFSKPVVTQYERTARITKGHLLRIEENEIKDVTPFSPATYKVIDCKGNINDTVLLLELEHLYTGETLTLNVK